jgi:hypothetical protein
MFSHVFYASPVRMRRAHCNCCKSDSLPWGPRDTPYVEMMLTL